MKKLRLLPVILNGALLLYGILTFVFVSPHREIPATSAPVTNVTLADDSLPFDKVQERLKQIDDDLTKQVDAFVAVVDSEFAAGRISDTVAQLLRKQAGIRRFSFSKSSSGIREDNAAFSAAAPRHSSAMRQSSGIREDNAAFSAAAPPHIVAMRQSGVIPEDNAALSAAAKELKAAFALRQFRTDVVVSSLRRETQRWLKDAVLGKIKPEESAALARTLEQILTERPYAKYGGRLPIDVEFVNRLLGAIKQFAEAESNQSVPSMTEAVKVLRDIGDGNERVAFVQNEINLRINSSIKPMLKAKEDKAIAIEAMLEARKPAQEISGEIKSYSEVIQFLINLKTIEQSRESETTQFYNTTVKALKCLEVNGDEQPLQKIKTIEEAREALLGAAGFADTDLLVGGLRRRSRQMMIEKIRNELLDKNGKLYEQAMARALANIVAQMAAVRDPADIDPLWQSLSKMPKQTGVYPNGYHDLLGNAFSSLQHCWKMNNSQLQMLPQFDRRLAVNDTELPAPVEKELIALRNRIHRSLFLKILKNIFLS